MHPQFDRSRRSSARYAPEASFSEVLAAAQSGSGWAFERLWRDNARHLEAFLRAQRDPDPAETTNEAFRRAFVNLDRFEGNQGQFRAWVFRIARNLRIDRYRADTSRPTLVLVPDTRSATVDPAEETALGHLDAEAARKMVADLPPDQRDVVLLRILAELSVEETADALGKRPGAVRALQFRGLRALRRRLEELEDPDPAQRP